MSSVLKIIPKNNANSGVWAPRMPRITITSLWRNGWWSKAPSGSWPMYWTTTLLWMMMRTISGWCWDRKSNTSKPRPRLIPPVISRRILRLSRRLTICHSVLRTKILQKRILPHAYLLSSVVSIMDIRTNIWLRLRFVPTAHRNSLPIIVGDSFRQELWHGVFPMKTLCRTFPGFPTWNYVWVTVLPVTTVLMPTSIRNSTE